MALILRKAEGLSYCVQPSGSCSHVGGSEGRARHLQRRIDDGVSELHNGENRPNLDEFTYVRLEVLKVETRESKVTYLTRLH